MVYRRNFVKYLEKSGIKISNQQIISPLVGRLCGSEAQEVKNYYKKLLDQRKKLRMERLLQYIPNNHNLSKRKQSPDDDNKNEISTNNKRQYLTE